DPRQVNYIQQVLSSVAGNSARGIALRESLPARMADAASELTIEQLNVLLQYSHYTSSRNPEMTRQHQAQWATAAARLKTRWSSLNDPKAKHAMGNLLSQVLPRVDSTGYLPFLRERLVQEAPEYHLGLRSSLYHHLFSQELTAAIETELFNLLPQLDAPEQPGTTILYARITRFQQLVERLLQDRTSKLHAAIKDKEKLDRVKLQEQQTAATREAHRQVAVRLQQRDVVQLTPLVPWIAAEEIFHRIKAGEAPAGLAASTWSAFEALPAATKVKPEDIKTFDELDQFRTALLYEGLRDRHLTVLTYLATLPKAQQPAASEKLKTFLIGKLSAEPANDYWRANWQRLLIALDQPKELEASLREWVLTSGTDQQYRLMLAYLQAERGGLQEAVALLEKVKADDELAPADWRALSDWLLVLNEQARHRQAKVEQYATASEQALYGFLQKQHALVSRQGQGVPSSLNEDTFLVIPELFRKTQSPTNYFHMVQALYEATKDFRLLTGLADGTLGHTPGNVYQLLQSWRQLISVLQEEATLDELSKRISLLRQSTTSNVDRRVLDLLQAFLHRKAATQINQPGDHAKLAIECLQRAMKHSWHPEEPAALAQLILQLHQEDHAAWKEELQTVYSKLMELTKPGSPERATVAFYYSLYHPQPFQLLEKMICEVRAHQPSGLLPEFSQQIVGAYLNMSIGHEQATEALAQQELARPGYSTASREWFKQQLHAIYLRAYQNKGT
ncbi:MAG TPA: hypothetical protein PLX97_05670, partial [Gemmatales bacterium]|nr:hypothetical protein [Gemmatales bacterium]